ncbi:MAG TPA: bifunctional enoyl-CoA hydratase/phosphate acetyltransferase [Rectinemataceae bacterium]|nr:bifunctional enoyl-CoA hydratase/phosphate acetyltransferase [Rectinemataceae bacterium]
MLKTMADVILAAKAAGRKRVAVAAAQEASVLEAVVDAWKNGIAEPVLVGDLAAADAIAAELGLDLKNFERHEAKDNAAAAAKAVELVKTGAADMVMKGILDTSVLLKAVLNKEAGLNAGRLVTHVVAIEMPTYHKLLFVTDAAITIAPDVNAKVDMIANAVRAARALGVQTPKVALLAAVEKVNWEKMPCTVDAAILTQMNRRGQIKDCLVDGPLAFDNAISAESAKIKHIVSEVAGDADILVAPDIEAGNILYKALIDLGQGKGAAIVMGAAKPIILTSRSDSAETKLASIALAALAS